MPYTPKQVRFFEGIKHGMKPRSGKGPSKATASKMLKEVGGKATRSPLSPDDHGNDPPIFGKKRLGSADKKFPKKRR